TRPRSKPWPERRSAASSPSSGTVGNVDQLDPNAAIDGPERDHLCPHGGISRSGPYLPASSPSNRLSHRPAVSASQHDHRHKCHNEEHDSQQIKQDVVAYGSEVDAADTEEPAYDPNHPPGETAHCPISSRTSPVLPQFGNA